MRKIALLMMVAILAVGVTGCKQAEKPPEKPKVVIPRGKVLVSDEILRTFSDQPGVHMQLARDALRKKDTQAAARELRLADGFMKLELARAQGPGKAVLKASVDEVARTAADLERGAAMSTTDLNGVLARSHYALAVHHYFLASNAMRAKADKKAGHDIAAAAGDAEAVFKWIKRKAAADETAVISSSRDLAAKIIEGTALGAEEASTGLAALKAHLDNLATSVEPAAPVGDAAAGTEK